MVAGNQSLTLMGSRNEIVNSNHAMAAGQQIYLAAGMNVVIEAGAKLTLSGPAGFITIDSSGVAIQGTIVLINSGGTPGVGKPPNPAGPDGPDNPDTPDSPDSPQEPADARPAEPVPPDSAHGIVMP
jgi:type VI secretion system secreted protein VgrG